MLDRTLLLVCGAIFTHRDAGSDAVIGLWTSGDDLYCEVKDDGRITQASGTAGVTLSTGQWYYVALTRTESGAIQICLNESSYSLGTCSGNITPSQDLFIGQHTSGQYFDGVIDELRFSNIQRSDSWLRTCFRNQNNPNGFYSVSNEKRLAVDEPVITDEQPINSSSGISFNPTLQAIITDDHGDTVSWYIKSNCTGSWSVVNSGSLADGNGTVSATTSNMNAYGTLYYWSVNASDGSHWTNETYHFTTELAPASWWNSDWHIRKELTINHNQVTSQLSNFPVLVKLVDSDLAAYAQSDADDLVFTDYNANKLNHEIEYYNSSNGELVCWVNCTSVYSDVDTHIYIYYGNSDCGSQQNPSGVWDSSYKSVLHFDEVSGSIYDSSSYGNDGTPSGGIDQNIAGFIDGCDEFDGINSQITIADDNSLDFGLNSFTITAWINLTKTAGYQSIVEKRNSSNQGFWFNTFSDGKIQACIEDDLGNDNQGAVGNTDVCTGDWRYVAGVFDRVNDKIVVYVDGVFDGERVDSSVVGSVNTTTFLHIGYYPTHPVEGLLDEICISEVARSSDWINTSYLNQRDPFGFLSVGSKETTGTGVPFIMEELPGNSSTSVGLNPLLEARVIDYEGDSVSWSILSNSSGNWFVIDSGTVATGSGLIDGTPMNITNYDTLYYWSVNVTDNGGSGLWNNVTYDFTTTFAPSVWMDTDWLYRKSVLIDHEKVYANSNLSNFPILIDVTDGDLVGHAQYDGDDIVFTDYNGIKLNHEIEFYDGTVGSLVAWVNVTNLSGDADTKLYMYYGNLGCTNQENPSDVWHSSYKMVQHLPHNWIPYPQQGTSVYSGGTFASIFPDNSTYHMYYHGGGVGHATSNDGKNWIRDSANNPVLSTTEGIETAVGVPFVWKEGDIWYMLYRGQFVAYGEAAGLATSSDGLNWNKHPNNPVLDGDSGEWDSGGAEIWGTIKIDDTYYTYYEVYYAGSRHIGIANSTDLVNWTKDPNNPIMSGLGPYDTGVGRFCPDIFRYEDYFYMLVPHYMSGTNWARIELYRDTNPTFYSWEREYLGPVKPCSHSGFDSHDQDTPCVLTDNIHRNSYNITNQQLWTYHDGEAGGRQVGLLISPSIPQALKGVMRDSTIYGNHGDGAGVGDPVPEFSIIGGCVNIDGVDEYMVIENDTSLDIDDNISIEAWLKLDVALSAQPNGNVTLLAKRTGNNGYALWFNSTNEELTVAIGNNQFSLNVSVIDWTDWHLIMISYDTSKLIVYIDSELVQEFTVSGNIGINDVNLCIGDFSHMYGDVLDGCVDEIRISDVVRNWNWINTSYENQYNQSDFTIFGDEENIPSSGDLIPPEILDEDVIMSDPIDTIIGWGNISCTVTDNVEVDSVWLNVTYPDLHTENISMTKSGDLYYHNTTFSDEGNYSYFIWANDTSGNIDIVSVETFIIPPNWDINLDHQCSIIDLILISNHFDETGGSGWIREDLNNDGDISIIDLIFVAGYFDETWG